MFTYLNGVELNESRLKTTSRFREIERTLVLKIQSLMNPTLSEKRQQNYKINVWWLVNRQLRLLYSILWLYSDECIHGNRLKNAERNKDGLNLFWDGGLWCSAKLTVASKHLLWSFNNKVFSLKKGALSDCFLQNICSKNQKLTQNFQSSRKAEHFLISSFIADFRKFQKFI